MKVIRHCVCVMWLAAMGLAATPNPPHPKPAAVSPSRPNIVLITLDTTRADRMGFLGSKRGLTPNLDALAQQSAVFTHAYAQAPITPTSHATILTGTYPQFHQVNDFRVPLAASLPYAPDLLHAHGYHTAAFIGSMVLDAKTNYAPGFDRGFDKYDSDFHPEDVGQKGRYRSLERRGGEVVTRALAWLAQHPKGPFFIWVHLYDAHDPYDPPEPYKTRYSKEPYDGEIAYVDSAIGKLLQGLKSRGFYDGTSIAIMADHGESLGAHGEDTHGIFLYDETIQVPLLIKPPSGFENENLIDNRVQLVDVMPTLLQTAGVAVPAEVQGQSLLPVMKQREGDAAASDAWRDRPGYAETDYPHNAFGWSALRALRTGKYLYVQAPSRELYDEAADPKAEHNLAAASTAVADTLAGRLVDFRQKTAGHREAPKATVDPAAQQNLAALGYASTGSGSKAGPVDQGADPKDKIEISNIFHKTNELRQSGRIAEEAEILQQLLIKEPTMPGLYAKIGADMLDLKKYKESVPMLRKAAEADPDSPMARVELAKGLMGSGDFAAAVPELEFAVAKMPKLADAHIFLESAYAHTNQIPETIKECKIVLQFLPNHFGSYLILGRFLEMSGDFHAAIPNLKKAAALRPKAPEAHLFLADAYEQLGQMTDAAEERAIAKHLSGN